MEENSSKMVETVKKPEPPVAQKESMGAAQPSGPAQPGDSLPAQSMEARIAAMEQQLVRQNDLIARQTALLEKQERRALYRKILLAAKVAVIVALLLWLGPKAYAAWQQYQAFLAEVNGLVEQVQSFTGDVEHFIGDVGTQIGTLNDTLSGLQQAVAPVTAFLAKFGLH